MIFLILNFQFFFFFFLVYLKNHFDFFCVFFLCSFFLIFSYVYNDFQTALVGEFHENLMISGQKSIITNAICQDNELILTFSQPSGPIFKYNPPTPNSFGLQPLVPDPMEASMVYVADSNVPHGGHGLFAKKDLEMDTIGKKPHFFDISEFSIWCPRNFKTFFLILNYSALFAKQIQKMLKSSGKSEF